MHDDEIAKEIEIKNIVPNANHDYWNFESCENDKT